MIDSPVNIYFARGLESGLVKIGATFHIPQRLRSLATRTESVELVASIRAMPEVEYELHDRFAHHLEPLRGREWFHDDGEISEFIAGLPVANRGSVKFLAFETISPFRYDTTNELLFPRRPFRSLAEILALDSFAVVDARTARSAA